MIETPRCAPIWTLVRVSYPVVSSARKAAHPVVDEALKRKINFYSSENKSYLGERAE